ncbi:hypothetical protein CKA32_000713 [Geitlerinema sp. FC II]|nr:hypothetical protein CKA32_000713 [Geitlerinema sp. FC II]
MDILTDGGDLLQDRDYTIAIDRSATMTQTDSNSGLTLQAILQDATLAFVTQCEQFDFDGITLGFAEKVIKSWGWKMNKKPSCSRYKSELT